MGLGQGDVTFWTCPNTAHTAVRAEGSVKVCEVCGLTSAHTGALIDRGQADQRQRDLMFLRDMARQIRVSRELILGGEAATADLALPLTMPPGCVEAVADLLQATPVGAPSGE